MRAWDDGRRFVFNIGDDVDVEYLGVGAEGVAPPAMGCSWSITFGKIWNFYMPNGAFWAGVEKMVFKVFLFCFLNQKTSKVRFFLVFMVF